MGGRPMPQPIDPESPANPGALSQALVDELMALTEADEETTRERIEAYRQSRSIVREFAHDDAARALIEAQQAGVGRV
jgi:hypothetical protein